MSWDYKHVPAPVNRAAECRALVSDDYKVLKDALVGTTWYAAVQNKTTGEVRALIVLIHIDRKDHCNFGVNWMNELDGPYYYDCPKSILDLLTPTGNTLALEWRRKCRERLKMKETLRKAPCGTRFIVTLHDGSTRTVIKKEPGFQFKTWWFLVEHNGKYLPKNRITAAQSA